ncbi:MAG: histidinol-phosphate transaminase [bacterium]
MKKIDIKKLLRVDPGQAPAYEIPVFPEAIKLDANENPYEIPVDLLAEVLQNIGQVLLNRYPDPGYGKVRRILSGMWGWPYDRIILGNGSDELIQVIMIAFGGPGKKVFIPTPSFAMYRIIARSFGDTVEEIPLSEDFDLVLSDALRDRMYDPSRTGNLIFLAVPNNPTGNCFSRSVVQEIVENFQGIVCIDEAYTDFSDTNFLDLLSEHPNLIILRTLSKIGLAAIRMGFLLADEAIIQNIQRIKLPYNINSLAEAAASVVLSKREVIEASISQVKKNRTWLHEQMMRIEGIRVYPSRANFILFQVNSDAAAPKLLEQLLSEGILIRGFGDEGRLKGHFRVTVGTQEECSRFVEGLRKILRSH